jgi:hypothetical protein
MTTIEILQQVHDLTLTPQQALPLIRAAEADRCGFAAAALSGLLATGTKPPTRDALAQEAFLWADCMVACAQELQG